MENSIFNPFSGTTRQLNLNVTEQLSSTRRRDWHRIKCLAIGHLFHLTRNVSSASELIYIECHDCGEKLLWRSGTTTICFLNKILHRILIEGKGSLTIKHTNFEATREKLSLVHSLIPVRDAAKYVG